MTGLTKSRVQLEAELTSTLELLRQANRIVGTHPSIGAQELSVKICEHFAAIRRQEKKS